eukprot:TRINITY_DN11735_c0_g1_i2.p3 TRINITY_DN11735_c0_g1~~TRINITY_DN11735_c0_g1_i2.p3  ORF type:complete len:136 (-),score=21.41 TRINITY_DN11735_c0_g1_i2:2-409(-)
MDYNQITYHFAKVFQNRKQRQFGYLKSDEEFQASQKKIENKPKFQFDTGQETDNNQNSINKIVGDKFLNLKEKVEKLIMVITNNKQQKVFKLREILVCFEMTQNITEDQLRQALDDYQANGLVFQLNNDTFQYCN